MENSECVSLYEFQNFNFTNRIIAWTAIGSQNSPCA